MSDQQGWVAPGTGSTPSGTPDPGHDSHAAFEPTDLTQPVPPSSPTIPVPTAPPPVQPGYAPAPPPAPYPTPYPTPPVQQMVPAQPMVYVEYRPGIIPLRPLTMSEIWSGVMTAVRGNPAATIGLALVTTLITLVPLTLLGIWVASIDLFGSLEEEFATEGAPFVSAQLGSLVPALAPFVTGLLLQLFVAFVIGQAVQGRKVSLSQTWAASKPRVLSGIGAFLLTGLIVLLASAAVFFLAVLTSVATDSGGLAILVGLVGFCGLVLLLTRLSFVLSIVALEQAGPGTAIARSFRLTRGSFWRIFGIRLLTAIVVGLAGGIITMPVSLAGSAVAIGAGQSVALWLLPVTEAIAVLIQSVLTTPFSAGVDSLLYVDRRIRTEGLDVQLLQMAQARHGA